MHPLCRLRGEVPLLLEDEERRDPKLATSEELDTLLCVAGCLNHDIVQGADGGGDGDVVLLVDGAEVA